MNMFVLPVGNHFLHTGMQTGNIAAMNAISRTDSEVRNMKMTPEEFAREKAYQSCMYFVRRMLAEGVIDELDFERSEELLRDKYKPVTSYLLSCNDLLCVRSRGLIDTTE